MTHFTPHSRPIQTRHCASCDAQWTAGVLECWLCGQPGDKGPVPDNTKQKADSR